MAWDDDIRGPCGIRYGVWIPRDPNYVKKNAQKAAEQQKAPANDWIKIKVVDDQSGEVIQKVKLSIKTPDNSTEEHETRLSGLVESLGLQSGNCEVSCDLKDATIENTLSFVGVGENPIEQNGAAGTNQGTKATSSSGTKYIASIEEHKVKTGETLKSIARSAGMTWQALAKFNWSTDVPDEINKHLEEDIGCTKKTADGKDYLFDDSDSPGVLYIPKKWQQSGLATNQVHTIHIQNMLGVKAKFSKLVWKKDGEEVSEAFVGDKVVCCADVSNIEDGEVVELVIYERDENGRDEVKGGKSTVTIKDGKIAYDWEVIYMEDMNDSNSEDEREKKGYTLPEYVFELETHCGKYPKVKSGESVRLDVVDFREICLKDENNNPIAGVKYVIYDINNVEITSGNLDDNGCAKINNFGITRWYERYPELEEQGIFIDGSNS